jgi:hypothetical protein
MPRFSLLSMMTVPNVWIVLASMLRYNGKDEVEVMLRVPYCVMLPRLTLIAIRRHGLGVSAKRSHHTTQATPGQCLKNGAKQGLHDYDDDDGYKVRVPIPLPSMVRLPLITKPLLSATDNNGSVKVLIHRTAPTRLRS